MPAIPQLEANAPWKKRYDAASLWSAKLARYLPERGIVISAMSGTSQIYAWDVSSGILRPLTHNQGGVFTGTISPDGRYVYYLHDQKGNERGHYVRIPWDGEEAQDLTPAMSHYSALYRCAVSLNGTVFAFTPTEANGFPLYCLTFHEDGKMNKIRELYRSPKFIDDVALSSDARLVVIATTEHALARQYSLIAFETSSGKQVGEISDIPDGSIRAVLFSPLTGDERLLAMADRSGFSRPLLWNPRSGERVELAIGDLAGDLEALDWSLDGRSLLLRQVLQAVDRLYIYHLETSTLTHLSHPAGTYLEAEFGPKGQIFSLWTDATHPPQLVMLDAQTGNRSATLFSPGEPLPTRPFRSIRFRSLDGTEIQGWLGLPDGAGPFPTILFAHGGPLEVAREVYDPDAQVWLDHGYAYVSINYRGSTTFGREFKEQIWGDLGHWEVEDMVAAHDWLIDEGIAQSGAIFVTGASYGGYLTLMALGKYPELWAGGMALVAPADFTSEYYEGTDWTKGYLTAMMGGTPEVIPQQYSASSPITYVEQVSAPLLVIQACNDLRCPPRQMEQYAKKMQTLGKSFEIDWFDAGHAGLSIEQSITFQERMLDFAYRILIQRNI
ncbi:MAG TPA: prolyl oligopeptidase family serine peptidase [Ktedonosporobacter sp.]|nr:prolyl oligopeptidase family serine peptidase [Ktedonosporobacter sp.]